MTSGYAQFYPYYPTSLPEPTYYKQETINYNSLISNIIMGVVVSLLVMAILRVMK